MMATLRIWSQRLLRQLGPQGLVGVALLAVSLALLAAAPRLLRQAQQLHEAAEARESQLQRVRSTSTPSASLPAWQRFSARFPARSQSAEDLKQVFAAARRNGVSLSKGEYQLVVEPNSPFVSYAATFPLHEGYGDIKKFTADVLRSLPHAAMEELRMERNDATSGLLDARIRITLIYRAT